MQRKSHRPIDTAPAVSFRYYANSNLAKAVSTGEPRTVSARQKQSRTRRKPVPVTLPQLAFLEGENAKT